MPLLRGSRLAYPVNTVVYIHKELFCLIVYVTKNNFTVTIEPHCIWFVVKLTEDQFSHLDSQHSSTQFEARDGGFRLRSQLSFSTQSQLCTVHLSWQLWGKLLPQLPSSRHQKKDNSVYVALERDRRMYERGRWRAGPLTILSMFPICLTCLQEVRCPTRECQQKVLWARLAL